MNRTYLIDGYNLIHALGMIQKEMEAGGLEASRQQLLTFLAKSFADDAERVTIVFDAHQAPRGVPRQMVVHGLHVHFAPKGQTADDWIESLIAKEANPKTLIVVSNDHRLQQAARRRGAQAWSDQDLLDSLESPKSNAQRSRANEDGEAKPSANDMERWLKEFDSIEKDPELKEFFDQDKFE